MATQLEEWKHDTPGFIVCPDCGVEWFCHYGRFYGSASYRCGVCPGNSIEWRLATEKEINDFYKTHEKENNDE
jgi:hypothetical protein